MAHYYYIINILQPNVLSYRKDRPTYNFVSLTKIFIGSENRSDWILLV